MTQEEKGLLLKDLCARLPYGVKVQRLETNKYNFYKLEAIDAVNNQTGITSQSPYMGSGAFTTKYAETEEIKPYLFPLSSMTEEQKKYINDRWGVNENFDFEIDPNWGKFFVELGDVVGFFNWCYENHLDINGLIPRGLAEDATDKNIY